MSDELRQLLERAHRADAPPPFAAVLNKRPRAQRDWVPAFTVATALVIAAAIGVTLSSRVTPQRPPALRIAQNGLPETPLDFLLHPQGQELFSKTPRFDARGLP